MGTESFHSFTGNETIAAAKVGDFTPFYVAIAACTVVFVLILILNVIFCCSRHSDYWLDRHTGNRFIITIWSSTPHRQPPLDLSELEKQYRYIDIKSGPQLDYHLYQHREELPSSLSRQPLTSSQEYLELHKRESDI